jgi:WD40 repeat protein
MQAFPETVLYFSDHVSVFYTPYMYSTFVGHSTTCLYLTLIILTQLGFAFSIFVMHLTHLLLRYSLSLARQVCSVIGDPCGCLSSFIHVIPTDYLVQVWDSRSLTCLKTLQGHEDNVRVLCVGAGFLFSGSWDKTIRVWDLGQGFIQHRVLEGHLEAVLALAVGDNCLVSGSYDTTVRFWDLSTLRCVRKCDGHDDAVRVLAAADGLVFSGSYDGSIGVW